MQSLKFYIDLPQNARAHVILQIPLPLILLDKSSGRSSLIPYPSAPCPREALFFLGSRRDRILLPRSGMIPAAISYRSLAFAFQILWSPLICADDLRSCRCAAKYARETHGIYYSTLGIDNCLPSPYRLSACDRDLHGTSEPF